MVKEVNEAQLRECIDNSKKPIFITFHTLWSSSCRSVNSQMEDISNKYSGKMDFYKIDCDKNRIFAADFGVTQIPCFFVIDSGVVKRKMSTETDREKIEKFIGEE